MRRMQIHLRLAIAGRNTKRARRPLCALSTGSVRLIAWSAIILWTLPRCLPSRPKRSDAHTATWLKR